MLDPLKVIWVNWVVPEKIHAPPPPQPPLTKEIHNTLSLPLQTSYTNLRPYLHNAPPYSLDGGNFAVSGVWIFFRTTNFGNLTCVKIT